MSPSRLIRLFCELPCEEEYQDFDSRSDDFLRASSINRLCSSSLLSGLFFIMESGPAFHQQGCDSPFGQTFFMHDFGRLFLPGRAYYFFRPQLSSPGCLKPADQPVSCAGCFPPQAA